MAFNHLPSFAIGRQVFQRPRRLLSGPENNFSRDLVFATNFLVARCCLPSRNFRNGDHTCKECCLIEGMRCSTNQFHKNDKASKKKWPVGEEASLSPRQGCQQDEVNFFSPKLGRTFHDSHAFIAQLLHEIFWAQRKGLVSGVTGGTLPLLAHERLRAARYPAMRLTGTASAARGQTMGKRAMDAGSVGNISSCNRP